MIDSRLLRVLLGLALALPGLVSGQGTEARGGAAALAGAQIEAIGTCDLAFAVEVEATAGTPGPTGYPTVKAAFDAINAGTHQGVINIEVCLSTTEGTTPATLNSSGAGSALYTSVNLRPLADGLTISGNPATGFGVIQLKGADNVTIDGDNPNTGGTNRNLTITNTNTATAIAGSVIRIATAATVVTSADNNTIRNLVLTGNVTGGNLSTITSATGSSNSSFVIYAGGNGGATAIDAPTAITSVTTNTAPSGTTINNLVISNNAMNQAARAVVFVGAATSVSNGVTLTNNVIGASGALVGAPPYTSPASTVYTRGIYISGTNAVTITGNTIQNVLSYVSTTMDAIELVSLIGNGGVTISNNTVNGAVNNGTVNGVNGILISASTSNPTLSGNTITNVQTLAGANVIGLGATHTGTGGLVEQNRISTIYSRGAGGFAANALNIAGGSAWTIQNNFVWDVNSFFNNGALTPQFGPFGIRIAGGTNHKIYNNTVNLFGAALGGSAFTSSAAFVLTATTITGVDVRNNIFMNSITGAFAGSSVAAVMLPSGGTSAMNLTWNNNDYVAPATIIAQVGTTAVSTYTAAAFNAGSTAGADNLRNYTSTLLAANTNNDNSSIVTDPVLVSATDLHITVASPAQNTGATIAAVANDIDSQLRPGGGLYDIGADEVDGVTPPANDMRATAFIDPTDGGIKLIGAAFSPQASFTNLGTTPQTNVPVRYRIVNAGLVEVYNQTSSIPSIAFNASATVTFPPATIAVAGNYTIFATAELPADTVPANDQISGTLVMAAPLAGTFTVGAGGSYTSLTNNGGMFAAINALGASSNLTINIISDLSGETGANALNEIAGGFTVLIKPSGAARSITSTGTAVAVIKLNDADNVTIDGSLSGGTDRSLSITNTNTAASTAAVWVSSAINGAQNNVVKNTNLAGGADQSLASVFNFGIISSSSAAILTGGVDNDNNTYSNNFIKKVSIGVISIGATAANMNQTTTISGNLIGPAALGSDQISLAGVLLFNENLPSVVTNEIRFIGDAATTGGSSGRDHVGIALGTTGAAWSGSTAPASVAVTNANVSRNLIHDIYERATFSAAGIVLNASNSGNPTSNTIANNIIYSIQANGTSGDQTVGIGISNGNGDKVLFNSVYLSGDIDPGAATAASTSSFGISVAFATPTNLTLKNNISVMDVSSNTGTLLHSAINVISTGYIWGTGGSDYNDWHAPAANPQSRVGTTAGTAGVFYATLPLWQAAVVGQDVASKSVDPLFVSPTDLHLQATSTLIDMGLAGTGVTNDFDNDSRLLSTPDIGADEIAAVTYTLTYTAGPNGTISGTSPQTVASGANGTAVTAVPDVGYHFVDWSDASTANPRTDSNVTANISVTANFAINTYTLTYTAGANGTISGTSPQTVNHGASGTAVTAVPDVGYHFVDWSDASTANPRTDSNVTANISVTANFAINTYTLTYTAGANGTISGTSPQTVSHGASGTAVTAVPDVGYHFVNWSDASTANPRTDTNVTANISVTANFAINTYTLTYTAGVNGSISGTSPQTVNHGASGTAVTAVADVGYHFVDWSDASTANPRTDTNVTANISVTANFAINTYTLTYTAGANGSITGTSPQTVNHGASGTAVTAVPDAGYHFLNWSDASTANPRTDSNVTANISVTANFEVDAPTYTLTYTAGPNGSITGTSPQTVNSGENGTPVTAVPDTGYHFVNWSDASTANPRTDTNVTTNISVTANFAINTYTLTYTAGANGTILGTSPQTVNHGANGTAVTAVPDTGYHFVDWSDASTANPRTDSNVTANINVTANFAINTYTLTYTAGANGSISGTTPQTVNHGANGTAVTAVPNANYHFVNWSDASTANPRTDTNVTANISVTANFAINNAAPTIAAVGVTRRAGDAGATATIANVTDAEDALNTLAVSVNGGATATVNGVTVNGITTSVAGVVSANVVAACGATTAAFTLRVTDSGALFNEAALNVTVNPNLAPTLTYAAANAVFGQSLNLNPATGPSDSGSVTGVAVQSPGTYTGGVTVNSAGVVSLTSAAPVGVHTIVIRATDNCAATTDANLALTVGQAATTTAITSDTPDPSFAGQSVTVIYTVTANAPGAGTPAGSVTVGDGVDSCTATVAAGQCSLALSTPGARTLTATYAGNASFAGSAGTASHTVSPTANLSITKTVNDALIGTGVIQYTITVANAGPSPANGITVVDTFPAVVTGVNWTCAGTGGGACSGSGSGNINQLANLPVGGTVVYSITGSVALPLPNSISNTATVAAPAGTTDPSTANNSSTAVTVFIFFRNGFEDGGVAAPVAEKLLVSANGGYASLQLPINDIASLPVDQESVEVIRFAVADSLIVVQTRRLGDVIQVRSLQVNADHSWTAGNWTSLDASALYFEWSAGAAGQSGTAPLTRLRMQQ